MPEEQSPVNNRIIQNYRGQVMYFKLKCYILYLNFQVTLITSFIITFSLCSVPGWITHEGEEQKAAGMHGSWILFSFSWKKLMDMTLKDFLSLP